MIKIENVSFTYENADNDAAILDNSMAIPHRKVGAILPEVI